MIARRPAPCPPEAVISKEHSREWNETIHRLGEEANAIARSAFYFGVAVGVAGTWIGSWIVEWVKSF